MDGDYERAGKEGDRRNSREKKGVNKDVKKMEKTTTMNTHFGF